MKANCFISPLPHLHIHSNKTVESFKNLSFVQKGCGVKIGFIDGSFRVFQNLDDFIFKDREGLFFTFRDNIFKLIGR